MKLICGTTDFNLPKDKVAVAIGKFDGVHVGHRRLLSEILEKKKEGYVACVFTFDPSPAKLFGLSDGRELSTREEKRSLFEKLGVDIVIEFPLTFETANILAEEFVREYLCNRMHVGFVAAGEDLSFGRKGTGNAALLQKLSGELGYQVKLIQKVCIDGEEVSSSRIRNCVEEGDMEMAERLLGAAYSVCGRVVRGNQIGRTLGFMTANLLPGPEKLMPPNGVYYATVRVGDRIYRAISNVGCKPTVSDSMQIGLESYLYDFDREIYGEEIEVRLHAFRRPEKRFDSLETLKKQLEEDVAAGAAYTGFSDAFM